MKPNEQRLDNPLGITLIGCFEIALGVIFIAHNVHASLKTYPMHVAYPFLYWRMAIEQMMVPLFLVWLGAGLLQLKSISRTWHILLAILIGLFGLFLSITSHAWTLLFFFLVPVCFIYYFLRPSIVKLFKTDRPFTGSFLAFYTIIVALQIVGWFMVVQKYLFAVFPSQDDDMRWADYRSHSFVLAFFIVAAFSIVSSLLVRLMRNHSRVQER